MALPTPVRPVLPVRLEWVAPADCPSRDEEANAIARLVGASELRGAFEARVVVTQTESEFRAEVSVSAAGTTNTRRLEADSCRAVADAAALIVALAASPAAELPAAPAPPPPPPLPKLADPIPSQPARPEARRPYFLAASLELDAAQLHAPAPGGELAIGWSPAHLHLEVGGALLGQQSVTLSAAPSQGAELWLARLGGRACYKILDASFDVGPCLGGGVEWVTARGFGPPPDHPESATAVLGVASLGGRAALRLSRHFTLRFVAEAVLPFVHPPFFIDGGGVVFQTPSASFRAALGAEAHS